MIMIAVEKRSLRSRGEWWLWNFEEEMLTAMVRLFLPMGDAHILGLG
jgi:hypothetical protein